MLLPRESPALLSIVIPMYNEEQMLPLLRQQLAQLINELLCRVEVILVDDGSTDRTYAIMHADLQDPPALIPEMIRGYCEGHDVVYGQRTEREGETWFKRASAAVFYRLMRRLVDRRLPADTGDFRLVSRRV